MKTAWFICGGGGGGSLGAKLADVNPVINLDYNPSDIQASTLIAKAYEENFGTPVIYEDFNLLVQRKGYAVYNRPHFIVASLPCTNYSQANLNVSEQCSDISLASNFVVMAKDVQPNCIWFENVPQWRKSNAWRLIKNALQDIGYAIAEEVCDSSKHGVPQQRKRFIARCSQIHKIIPPIPTEEQQGWYQAIKGLIPQFEEVRLTDKQKEHISPPWLDIENLQTDLLLDELNCYLTPRVGALFKKFPLVHAYKPCWTIRSAVLTDKTRKSGRTRSIDMIKFPSMKNITNKSEWWKQCEIYTLNRRAIARLMSFPDYFQLPEDTYASGHLLGQAIPPALSKNIFLSLL